MNAVLNSVDCIRSIVTSASSKTMACARALDWLSLVSLKVGSFFNGLSCESANHSEQGRAAHSVHRRALAPVGRPRHAVTLGAQLIKDIQHGFLARVHEGAAGDVLGVLEKLFGLGEFFHAASLRGTVRNRTQALLFKAVST